MDKIFLTIAEFSDLYGCKKTKIYQLINSGQVQRAKIGRRAFITAESAHSFAERCVINGTRSGNTLCHTHSDYGPSDRFSSSTLPHASREALPAQTAGKNSPKIFS